MRTGLVWMAAGAALTSLAFLISRQFAVEAEPLRKPYFLVFDNSNVEYSPEDQLGEANKLAAKRSARIAYQCGAKSLTTGLAAGVDDVDKVIVPADLANRNVTDCIQFHARKGEVMFNYVWLTDSELIFG